MAETRTARLSLPQWGAGTDAPSRADFDEAFLNLETNAAKFADGLLSARPAASAANDGMVYCIKGDAALINGLVFYCDGTTWLLLGQKTQDGVSQASAAGTVAFTVRAFTSGTADLMQWLNTAGTVVAKVASDGKFTIPSAALSGYTANRMLSTDGSGLVVAVKAIPAGVIVGTTDAQAMSNKDMTDPTNTFPAGHPVGSLLMWLDGAIPSKYLNLVGGNVSRTTYAALFALWGTKYGTGDGSTTFGLPDMRARFPVGLDTSGSNPEFNAIGNTGGAKSVNLQHQHYIDHTHVVPAHNHPISISYNCSLGGSALRDNAGNTGNSGAFNTGTSNERPYSDAALGSTGILSPYFTVQYLVRAVA